VYWQGSAGAEAYSVERAAAAGGPWVTICERCVSDLDDGYADVRAAARAAWYRVIPYNLDGKRGPASTPRQASAG
jgi:mannan endo-1,4-beta-mannosidase